MSRLKIRNQLLLSFGLLILVLGAFFWQLRVSYDRAKQTARKLSDISRRSSALNGIRITLLEMDRIVQRLLITQDPDDLPKLRSTEAKLSNFWDELSSLKFTTEAKPVGHDLQILVDQWRLTLLPLLTASAGGDQEMLKEMWQKYQLDFELIQKRLALAMDHPAELSLTQETEFLEIQIVALAGFLLVILICWFLLSQLRFSISEPIHALTDTTKKLAQGESVQTLNMGLNSARELGELETAFNQLLSFLIEERKKNQDLIEKLQDLFNSAQANKNRLQIIFDSTRDGMLLEDASLKLVAVNKRFGEIFGFNPFEYLQQDVSIVEQKLGGQFKTAEDYSMRLQEIERNPTLESHDTFEMVKPKPAIIDCFSRPVLDNQQRLVGRLWVWRDVTREAEIDRMKTEFISTVSHELRTPLTSIKGYTDLMLEGDAGGITPEQHDFLKIISQNANRLTNLVNDLLDVEKIESGKIHFRNEKVFLNQVLMEAIATFRIVAEQKGLKMVARLMYEDMIMSGDRDRLVQIFSNLLSNAVKYTKEGEIRVNAVEEEGNYVVSVEDTGIGMTPDDLSRVFTKFFRADNSYTREIGGTGLGLAIVKAAVERHGGFIRVESEVGVGTKFIVTLPMYKLKSRDQEITLTPVKEQEGAQPRPKVLIIDEDQEVSNLLSLYVTRLGLKPVVVSHSFEALSVARAEQPSFITMDLQLDGADGWQLLNSFRTDRTTENTPVVVISGITESARAVQQGAAAFLSKPFNEDQFADIIRRIHMNRNKKVLIIDDDKDFARLIERYLKQEGYPVSIAGNGISALYSMHKDHYAMVVLDYHLPDLAGTEVLKRIRSREEGGNIPVIMVSASVMGNGKMVDQIQKLGGQRFLSKDVGAKQIVAEVIDLINQSDIVRI